ncbi:YggS family pyridoxal phosphate-dependent enzyme [Sphingorhabdus arenilitoris]|uniref:Pyridoxal phosphate homeostasis protein n=1 Tax=Sphingorhabdus arenilitoris TaxID=1490041 RepID=A0ABV8RJH2_9SPHN
MTNAIEEIRAEMAKAAKIAGRKPQDVSLIAVSKTRTPDEIRPLLSDGQRVFGENRVQEAAAKWPELLADYPDVTLHLIGQLQSNKAAEAVALFDVIHSVDRASLITALGKAMNAAGKSPDCFLQVNIGGEAQKGGCAVGGIADLLTLAQQQGVPIIGLMCLPPADVEAAPYFALLYELAQRHALPALSMGMTADYQTAIMLGATHIRIGTALFGPRSA